MALSPCVPPPPEVPFWGGGGGTARRRGIRGTVMEAKWGNTITRLFVSTDALCARFRLARADREEVPNDEGEGRGMKRKRPGNSMQAIA